MKNPASGGGRWVEVPPERFLTWVDTFARRHGPVTHSDDSASVTFAAADGATAQSYPPFPPLPPLPPGGGTPNARGAAEAIVAHAQADRVVGVLLVRLGGYAAGVFAGSPPRLVSSKTGRRPVHGRSAAGGWSQHRFARRRENQAATALGAAADAAAGIFAPYGPDGLDAVVLGGDKRSMAGLRGDVRLAPYLDLAAGRFLTVPDPRPAVLSEIPAAYLAIRIRLTEPKPDRRAAADHVD
jgi:Actinobacteria/chloroflexi VLRF1 release factor